MTPRLIRMKHAPEYLGMSIKVFNETVRPCVREVVIGTQGIAFDRYELDAWVDSFMDHHALAKNNPQSENNRRIERRHGKGDSSWRAKPSPASMNGMGSGTSTRSSTVREFEKALAQARGKKQNAT